MDSPRQRLSASRRRSLIAIAVGSVLIISSWLWQIVAGANAWTDADAKEYSAAAADYHWLSHETNKAVPNPVATKSDPPTPDSFDKPSDYATALAQARTRLENDQGALKSTNPPVILVQQFSGGSAPPRCWEVSPRGLYPHAECGLEVGPSPRQPLPSCAPAYRRRICHRR